MELDEEQKAVVECNESQVVDAGPGSGKTRVLTELARRLINENRNIICLCFTRAAAAEMRSRVENLPATTIHSFCCQAVGWKVPKGGSGDDGYPYLLYRFINECDFKFDWVLVDECQDLNPEEMDVVLSMVGDKLFAVGDQYQSIYGFQGAMGPSVMDLFERAGCKKVSLKNNYRSCAGVVDRLNGIYPRGLVSKNVKDTGLTCVLCRRNDDVFEVSDYLKSRGIAHRIRLSALISQGRQREWDVLGKSDVQISTIHSMKGRECDTAIIYAWYPDDYEEEMRTYYVACARASKNVLEVPNLRELEKVLRND